MLKSNGDDGKFDGWVINSIDMQNSDCDIDMLISSVDGAIDG